MAPVCKSDSKLPGSRKAVEISKPGPVNFHSLLKQTNLF